MNHYRGLIILLAFLAVLAGNSAWAQQTAEPYVPPPMFGPAPTPKPETTADDAIAFPVKDSMSSNSLNPSAPITPVKDLTSPVVAPTPAPAPAPVAEAAPAAKPKKRVRKVPPVPPQRPEKLQASEAYIAEQKRLAEEEAKKKAEEAAAIQKELDEKVAKEKTAAEARAKAEIEAAKAAEAEAAKADIVVEEIPEEEPPPLPEELTGTEEAPAAPGPTALPAPPPGTKVDNTLLGQPLANPSAQEIYDSIDENKPVAAPKTPIPQGPRDPFERMVTIRSTPDSGPNVRIHAKRPPKKKEITQAFFLMFKPGQTEITETGMRNFDKLVVPTLINNPTMSIQIHAYATPGDKGDGEAQRVSLARANSIRTYFIQKNIAPERIHIHALGAQAENGAQDRVDIILQREVQSKAAKPAKPVVGPVQPAVNKAP